MLLACALSVRAQAEEWPSLFRGVAVADSSAGVRVVSVEPTAMAFQADLRPEDVILQIDDHALRTIDEFAVLSKALRGRAAKTRLVILRNGQPRELILHLYSYTLLREWGLTFIPDQELRFVDPSAGRSYWANLGRGFREAGQSDQALHAYLNALHHAPSDLSLAMTVSHLLGTLAGRHLEAARYAEALGALNQQVTILNALFEHPLSTQQLQAVKQQLELTVEGLKRRPIPPASSRKDS
jgi:tetratricopeptide (TPR) repeat protein